MIGQAPGFHRRSVGRLVVTAISDGYIELALAWLQGITAEEASAMLTAKFQPPSPRASVNAYLVQGGGRTVLIDTGAGGGMGPTMGRLLPNLAAAGVQPDEIDLVLLTHLHGDHVGGLATAEGSAVFGRAELAVSEVEAAFWLDRDPEEMPEGARSTARGAGAMVAPYRDRMRRLGMGSVVPGISPVPLPGHTPGHIGFRIEDGGEALLVWGDVIHVPDVQGPRPGVGLAFDVDPALAIETRRGVLDMAASEGLAVAGMHLHFPGFAHLAREGAGYAVVPETWRFEV